MRTGVSLLNVHPFHQKATTPENNDVGNLIPGAGLKLHAIRARWSVRQGRIEAQFPDKPPAALEYPDGP